MKMKVENLIAKIYDVQQRIKVLEEKEKGLKEKLRKCLEKYPDKKVIVVHPKLNIKIQGQIVEYEKYTINPKEFYERYSSRIDVFPYLKVDGNKVKEAIEKFQIFNKEEIKEIGSIEKVSYIVIKELRK